jgi:hypothetical protein
MGLLMRPGTKSQDQPCIYLLPHQTGRLRMDYKGIRYTIRARIVRNAWRVTVYPEGVEPIERGFKGSRPKAEKLAQAMIGEWLRTARVEAATAKLLSSSKQAAGT